MKKLANILLGVWLIVTGLVYLGGLRFASSGTLLAALGAITGLLLILADQSEKLWPRLGSIILGLWLLTNGLFALFHLHFSGSGVILEVLAVAAGVLILLRP